MILDIAIEPGLSPTDPVGTSVVIDSRACAHEAEEDMARRPDDNARVAAPHDQIAGLRVRNPQESLDSFIELVGVRIGIGETRSLINRMHQVRAVVTGVLTQHSGIEGGGNHSHAIVRSQSAGRLSRVVPGRLWWWVV